MGASKKQEAVNCRFLRKLVVTESESCASNASLGAFCATHQPGKAGWMSKQEPQRQRLAEARKCGLEDGWQFRETEEEVQGEKRS